MAYVIYHIDTLIRHQSKTAGTVFKLERTAKALRTKAELDPAKWVVATVEQWEQADHEIEVINCLSGKPVKIRKSDKGNPAVDPSMEGYHAM